MSCPQKPSLPPHSLTHAEPDSSKNVTRIGAEARLYSAMGGGTVFVMGALIYAWTSYSFVHWIAPCIGITIMIASVFTIYVSVFNYLADCTSLPLRCQSLSPRT